VDAIPAARAIQINIGTHFDWPSFGLALAAFLVALAALYLSSLKRAEMWAAVPPDVPPYLADASWDQEKQILTRRLHCRIAMFNSGARSGALTKIEAVVRRPEFFELGGTVPIPNFIGGQSGMLPFPAGDAQALVLEISLRVRRDDALRIQGAASPEAKIAVQYSYLRGRRLRLRRAVPLPITEGRLEVTVPTRVLQELADGYFTRE
jgi:hypothetical protein